MQRINLKRLVEVVKEKAEEMLETNLKDNKYNKTWMRDVMIYAYFKGDPTDYSTNYKVITETLKAIVKAEANGTEELRNTVFKMLDQWIINHIYYKEIAEGVLDGLIKVLVRKLRDNPYYAICER